MVNVKVFSEYGDEVISLSRLPCLGERIYCQAGENAFAEREVTMVIHYASEGDLVGQVSVRDPKGASR